MVVGPLDGQAPRSARKCCRLAGHAVTMPEINEALVVVSKKVVQPLERGLMADG